jgi:hypothetical protein
MGSRPARLSENALILLIAGSVKKIYPHIAHIFSLIAHNQHSTCVDVTSA